MDFTTITVKNSFFGTHKYENAPKEVEFLKNEHRHTFYVEVELQVFHQDRELEFYILQDEVEMYLLTHHSSLESSCEVIATDILNYLDYRYGTLVPRYIKVTVSEDNQNRCKVERHGGNRYAYLDRN